MKKLLIILFVILLSFSGFSQKCLIDSVGNIEKIGLPRSFERENGDFVLYGYGSLPDSIHFNDGWRNIETPIYNDSTQYLGSIYYNTQLDVCTYPVVTKTAQELEIEKEQRLNNLDNQVNLQDVEFLLGEILKDKLDSLPEEVIKHTTSIYPVWREGVPYELNQPVVYDTTLYKVVQPHTSQAYWTPDVTQALFTRFIQPGTISVWVQPIGAQDAYNTGDKVYFPTVNDSVYESLIDDNVWSPTAYPAGWQIVN